MKNSYRGKKSNAPAYMHTSGFVGPNKGPLVNALLTANTIGKLYSSLPTSIRWGLLGDVDAWREDQNTPNPKYDIHGKERMPEGYEEYEGVFSRLLDNFREDDGEEDKPIDYGDSLNYSHDRSPQEEEVDEEEVESAREAYEAGKEAEAEREEIDDRVEDGYDITPTDGSWKASTEITTVTPEEGAKSMEFEDSSAKEWQKFLVDNKYLEPTYKGKDGKEHNSVDGVWGDKSQEAYDKYLHDHPEEE